MIRILVSQCLFGGDPVRYDGCDKTEQNPVFLKWKEEGRLVPVCPEVIAGLPVPRPSAQIRGERVVTEEGKDVTAAYIKGAEAALKKALDHEVAFAVMKQKSPSCGSSLVYDGTFTGRLRKGMGITSAMLTASGIRVFGEDELSSAENFFNTLQENSDDKNEETG